MTHCSKTVLNPRRFADMNIWRIALLTALPTMVSPALAVDRIEAPQPIAESRFAHSVAADQDTLVLGAPYESRDLDGDNQPEPGVGAVYVYTRSGNEWVLQATLTSPLAAADHQYGYSVALDGDQLVVGERWAGDRIGIAYVYVRNGSNWSLQEPLSAPTSTADQLFGHSVAIDDGLVLIAAPYAGNGTVFVFEQSGGDWERIASLTASDGAAGDAFGIDVELDASHIVIGSPYSEGPSGETNGGAVYLFDRLDFSERCRLDSSTVFAESLFGHAITIDSSTIMAGQRFSERPVNGQPEPLGDTGSVLVFDTSSACADGPTQTLRSPTALPRLAFGWSVVLDDDFAVIGAPYDNRVEPWTGRAHFFRRDDSVNLWQPIGVPLACADLRGRLGHQVALTTDYAVVSAPFQRVVNSGEAVPQAGSACLFSRVEFIFSDSFEEIPQ